MPLPKRQRLRDQLDFMAQEYLATCPFATSVLNALVAAIDLDMDRELAEACIAHMRGVLKEMAEQLKSSFVEAVESDPRFDPTRN